MSLKQRSIEPPAWSTAPLPLDWLELHPFHALEVDQLNCSNETEKPRSTEDRRANSNAGLIPQLREANQNLMLATFGAQDLQAIAEANNQRQTEFLSMLAHELRNPLQPIIMANEMIGKIASAHPDLPVLHGIIQRQVGHLVRMVDDLLDASRASAGKISIQPSTIRLQDVIERTVETCQPIINTRKQQLKLEIPAQAIFIEGDLVRLTQVFSNLLLNASKYTPQFGHLAIRVTPGAGKVKITVSDDGAGVPLEIQPHIFDLFVQGPRPLAPATGGLGIGLSLVRSIVEQHGGSVRMHSNGIGTGSEFTVTLPRPASARRPN